MSLHSADSITLGISFFAGVASLISPCVLALLPVYVTYLSGITASHSTHNSHSARLRVLGNALLFILGFTIIFVAFGLTAFVIGKALLRNQVLLRQVSGIIVIIFGIHTTGLIKIPFLMREARTKVDVPHSSPTRSFILGMAFAAGWTPCVGPILGSIMALAANLESVTQGGSLLLAYSFGMALPFLLIALFLTRLRGPMRFVQQHNQWVSRITGILLIITGIMLYTNTFTKLASMFNYWELLP